MQTVRWPLWTSSQAQSKDTARPLLGAVFRVKGFGPWFSGGEKTCDLWQSPRKPQGVSLGGDDTAYFQESGLKAREST